MYNNEIVVMSRFEDEYLIYIYNYALLPLG